MDLELEVQLIFKNYISKYFYVQYNRFSKKSKEWMIRTTLDKNITFYETNRTEKTASFGRGYDGFLVQR